jgi:hypothetical protein
MSVVENRNYPTCGGRGCQPGKILTILKRTIAARREVVGGWVVSAEVIRSIWTNTTAMREPLFIPSDNRVKMKELFRRLQDLGQKKNGITIRGHSNSVVERRFMADWPWG